MGCQAPGDKTKSEHRRHVALTERFTEADLKGLPELNPPSLMPADKRNRRYGNVPFQYHNTSLAPSTEESVFTAGGHEISGPGSVAPPSGTKGPTDSGDPEIPEVEEEDAQSNADDQGAALRGGIELKGEKGGSGLVFYTDAQYWQEEEGDFDEQTADVWDVDMSVYYDKAVEILFKIRYDFTRIKLDGNVVD
ncbi:hypothetical protein J4Q44_G00016480 [Coregonus suidteri]|uniref:Uncharacterized protein n=1 Tax=Coregonus suidteri TaxID=861788 RepID=A0AAN8MAM1_9TELE